MQWFGPESWGAPICESSPRVETPIGVPCEWCKEPIEEGDYGVTMPQSTLSEDMKAWKWEHRPWHRECQLRAVFGGFNHLVGNCTCCGGSEPPDPPHLSPRAAAKLAVQQFMLNGPARRR